MCKMLCASASISRRTGPVCANRAMDATARQQWFRCIPGNEWWPAHGIWNRPKCVGRRVGGEPTKVGVFLVARAIQAAFVNASKAIRGRKVSN